MGTYANISRWSVGFRQISNRIKQQIIMGYVLTKKKKVVYL
jgi:hypothetical protein